MSKEEKYNLAIRQIREMINGEPDEIANLSNIIAILKHALGHFWTGFYFVKNNELVLGPFQGTVACTRILFGKGVCGTAWKNKATIVVPDVDKFPGHIACSSESKSEIVVPVIKNGEVAMVLDVDSISLDDFDLIDEKYLNIVAAIIAEKVI